MPKTNSNRTKQADKSRREELLSLLSANNWFPFRRDFCLVMDLHEAVFFQDLINKYSTAAKEDVDDEGYFRCTVEYLDYPPMNWTVKMQKKGIASLEEKGYLKRKLSRTTPPQRWLYLDLEKVMDDIREVQAGVLTTPRKTWRFRSET